MEKCITLYNLYYWQILIWADIDLTSMIPNLDNTASEIVQYQRDSTVQRKDLAQKTKDFRKLDDTAKLVEVKALLKGRLYYTQEIRMKYL